MITEIEDYFSKGCGRCPRFGTADCSTRRWLKGLLELRQICLASGLSECVKWGHPCYQHVGRNIAIIGALRGEFRLSFFDAALLSDSAGILERAGENSPVPSLLRFTEQAHVRKLRPAIEAYLREAMAHAAAGRRPPKIAELLELPEELSAAFALDPELAEAFQRLTAGRQKSYLLNLKGAKKSETRTARIAKFREKIHAGKGALER
ncbi:MAG: YdeI/OmpD-associated family protein [Planctomycetota bacterium]|jgi:uncharacterized protein YdeI (YjbR/CyaY-like superfamily)